MRIQSLTEKLLSAQTALASQAAVSERQRIAREIHDLVAHTLSVTMLHLTGARMSLAARDVDEARESLNEAERTGREALREMRQTVGLLGTSTTGRALPGAEDLSQLVAEYRAAGLGVRLETRGDVHAVPGDMGLTMYRIVQESLANVARHAPGEGVGVLVSVVKGEIRLTIRNELRVRSVSLPGGRGIPGMAERPGRGGGQRHPP